MGRSGERVSKKGEGVGRKGFRPPTHPIPLPLIFPLFRSFSPVRERLEKERKRLLCRLTAYFLSVPQLAQLLSHENVSSMSLLGWLSKVYFEDRPFRKKIDIFVCEMNVQGVTLAKPFFAKHHILSRASNVACSSPVSVVYSWTA